MDKEMELLLAEKEIKIGDKNITVKRIALLDTIRLASHLSSVVSLVVNSSEKFSDALYKVTYSGTNDEERKLSETQDEINGIRIMGFVELVGIIGEDGTELLKELIVKSTSLSDSEVEDIDCISGIDLISAIVEVNKGFFEKCMNKLKEKLPTKKRNATKKEEKSK